jgi:LacI family transcriptional regulator
MNPVAAPIKKVRTTINDVAKLSGVTKATVSKALDTTSRYGLSEDIRRRVAEAAQQLDYRPGGRGRAFDDEQSRTIALFYARATPSAGDVHERLIAAAAEALAARGCRMIHLPLLGDPQNWKNQIDKHRVAGALVIDPIDRAVENLLRGIAWRSVLLNAASSLPFSQVIVDAVAGASALTRHLLEKGHRRIAFYGGSLSVEMTQLRLEGFQQAMHKANLAEGASIVAHPHQFIERWSNESARPTAVITGTVTAAIELMQVCWRNGIRVPADLSIATLEDSALAEKLTPPLTAMRCPTGQLGSEAANLLVDQIEGEQSGLPRKILVLESLVVRESTRPV